MFIFLKGGNEMAEGRMGTGAKKSIGNECPVGEKVRNFRGGGRQNVKKG